MSRPTTTALLTCLLALLPVASNAQTCQTTSISATTPSSQLTDNGNGTVTDTKTSLMWKQCSEGLSGTSCATGSAQTYSWQEALAQAQSINTSGGFAGYTDWRLPNIKELRSITEKQCYDPAINLTRFPNTTYAELWSASPDASDGNNAWYVYFYGGYDGRDVKGSTYQVRLVRNVE